MRLARIMIVEVSNKPQLDHKIVGKTQEYSYVKGNRTRAFLLKLFTSQIRLLLTHGASQSAYLRRVCNKNKTQEVQRIHLQISQTSDVHLPMCKM